MICVDTVETFLIIDRYAHQNIQLLCAIIVDLERYTKDIQEQGWKMVFGNTQSVRCSRINKILRRVSISGQRPALAK